MHTHDTLKIAQNWLKQGHRVAMATVVKTWRSAPCPVGSKLFIRKDMAIEGSVSGGCVEAAVIQIALSVLESNNPVLEHFGVTTKDALRAGLACGGALDIWIEPITHKELQTLRMHQSTQKIIVRRVPLNGKAPRITAHCNAHNLPVPQAHKEDECFWDIMWPARRLFIVGAVHIAKALCAMVRPLGYQITILDPRAIFAAHERFPHDRLVVDWPDEVLDQATLDSRCAIVVLTHDPKIDDPALAAALKSDAWYIGALGSTRSHAKRIARLSAKGFDAKDLARIHGPVGLSIGAQTPAEIAASILVELIATAHNHTP